MTTTVSARIDSKVKQDAQAVLDQLGVSHSAVISALYAQIALRRGIPFAIELPEHAAPLTLRQIRDVVRPVADKYGMERVCLFGSYARGEATGGSDVDLRVDPGGCRGLAIGGFQDEVRSLLGIDVDVATTGSLSPEFRARIKEDEVLIYER